MIGYDQIVTAVNADAEAEPADDIRRCYDDLGIDRGGLAQYIDEVVAPSVIFFLLTDSEHPVTGGCATWEAGFVAGVRAARIQQWSQA